MYVLSQTNADSPSVASDAVFTILLYRISRISITYMALRTNRLNFSFNATQTSNLKTSHTQISTLIDFLQMIKFENFRDDN